MYKKHKTLSVHILGYPAQYSPFFLNIIMLKG